ncbi:hypothetical protein glysoja_049612 [Glycine soja]|uniref:Uncharacterized protein n=1 Tax=Glycine soja TaxID=3848 RepID=A0A0B2SRM6_GLYSO|nr:hypothetical protein glysoja_049612 [Glycine soja]
MTNNSMAISNSQNSVSFDLELTSSWLNQTSSCSQRPRCPPSPATNQPLETIAFNGNNELLWFNMISYGLEFMVGE